MRHRSLSNSKLALAFFSFSVLVLSAAEAAGEPLEAVVTQGGHGASDFAEDLRVQGFFFGGGTSMNQIGEALVELGGGADYVFESGLGIGGEFSALGNGGGGIGTAGVNLSYHFLPAAPGFEPFASGGMSFGSPADSVGNGYTWASASGGFNYWLGNGMALRVEAKGRYDLDLDDHTVGLRVGVTF